MTFAATTAHVNAQRVDNTLSIYGQGGTSWATGTDFENVNASTGTTIAPLVGVGVNYYIRPEVRLGLNYEFSKFKREQRFDTFQPVESMLELSQFPELTDKDGGIAYRNQWTQYHNIDLTAEYNIMGLWKNRSDKAFNLYVGTGIGVMFARGNTYTLGMGSELWVDPNNYVNGSQVSDNWASLSWVKAFNNRHSFNSLYVPLVLSAEYDLSTQWTLGVKGEYKFLFSSDDMAPNGVITTGVTVRYNFKSK